MKNFLKIVAGTFVGSLIAMVLGVLLLFGIFSSIASVAEKSTPTVPSSAILSLNFANRITEQSIDDPFADASITNLEISSKSLGILSVVDAIDAAATDPRIKFIYMNLNDIDAGISHVEEIRAALSRFHDSGKAIISYAENFSQGAYYLATVSDKIFLNPSGTLALTGLSVNSLFFKDLLDKIGIQAQLIRHGKFKAAAEQYISNKMSDENREQLQAYISAVWNTWAQDISKSRGISVERLNEITDNLEMINAQKVKELGFVDGLMYKDQLTDTLVSLFGVEKEKELKTVTLADYITATKKINLKEKNKIAVLYANGEIVMGKSTDNISSDNFVAMLSKIRKDSTIKAVVLRVNSPGGSAQCADIIERELKLLREKKPLVVSMGDYAASGGYWIAANADKIITNNTTLTGSIGVFSLALNAQKAIEKHLSINPETVNTHKHSDILSLYRSMDNDEVAFMQKEVEIIYDQFLNLVAEGRNLSVAQIDSVAQGRIWSGLDAIKIKLADEVGGIHEAIQSAAAMSSLESYRIVEYPVQKTQLDKIIEQLQASGNAAKVISDPAGALERTYMKLSKEKGVKTFARLPYNIYFN